MLNLYEKNGLIFWTEEQIKVRRIIEDRMVFIMNKSLKMQIERSDDSMRSSIANTTSGINPNNGDDIYMPAVMALTTYQYLKTSPFVRNYNGFYEYAK